MAAALKQICDALISLLESIPGIGQGRSGLFAGSMRSFLEEGRTAPFAGVVLNRLAYESLSSDLCLVRENLVFLIKLVAQDFRGPGYSLEDGYALLDAVRGALAGADLGIDGLAPLELVSILRDEKIEEHGVTAFSLSMKTWRITGRE